METENPVLKGRKGTSASFPFAALKHSLTFNDE
jgi:hypothetical protein